MAQHDYNLSNNTGALYRADNNGALQAIVTQNSGTTAPTVTFPGMLWLDLSGGGDGVMRRRNQANSAWLTDIGIDQSARDAAAAAQTTANAAVRRAGDTMTGPLNLPGTVPTNNNAVSRAQGDLLYQVRLPGTQAGALLYGLAGGWTGVLAPAANETILALSGGLPAWTSTTTVAAPNQVVRTKADGTIDPSLIPSVASGLRFRGTFKPAVNAEYPTTGGSGAGGVPTTGDFWVIDGLTTGGYTYLTGSLAGVTVYNGDSIALADGTNWYRMGSSVELEGYMKTDGSRAMTGNLNMGAHNLVEVGGIVARAGTPVPLNNFSIDASNVVISPQRGTTGPDLAPMATGQIGTDLGRMQLFVGAAASNTPLLPVRFHSTTAAYVVGDYVAANQALYRAPGAIAAGAFTATQWRRVVDEGGAAFSGAVTFGANITMAPGMLVRMLRTDSTLAGSISTAGNQMNLTVYDAAGANPVSPIAVRGGTFNDVGITKMYVDGTSTFNGQTTHRIGAGAYAQVYALDLTQNRFYVTGDNSSLAWNSLSDAGAFQYTPLKIFRDSVGVQIRGEMRVWGWQGLDGQGVIRWGAAEIYIHYNGTQFAFGAPCIGPSFTPTCDAKLKTSINEVSPRRLDALKLYEFTQDGKQRRGPVAQDVELSAPESVTEVETVSGSVKTVDLMALTYEVALNLRDRVIALEAAINETRH